MNPAEEFLSTWKRRKSGELPPVDLIVQCHVCQREIMRDEKLDFTTQGIACVDCLKRELDGLY